jgi:hypothetical protein
VPADKFKSVQWYVGIRDEMFAGHYGVSAICTGRELRKDLEKIIMAVLFNERSLTYL